MKTDIEIAQEAKMLPIKEVAAAYGIGEDDLELYGKYKAKITDELWNEMKDRKDGKLVLVTAINPTPAGEGKTTTSVGLGDALLREISMPLPPPTTCWLPFWTTISSREMPWALTPDRFSGNGAWT